MEIRFNRLILIALVWAAASATILPAQSDKQPIAPKNQAAVLPDLSGVWLVAPAPPGHKPMEGGNYVTDPAPMLPNAQEIFNYNKNPNDTNGHQDGRAELSPGVQCMPVGPTALWSYTRVEGAYFEIIQSAARVLLLFEYDHWIRQVWIDGRDHPADFGLTWMGHSIGKWDGDTLVVDTVGIHEQTWLDLAGHPHSDALRVIERIRRVDHDTLTIDVKFDDPKMYSKPWGGQLTAKLQPHGEFKEIIPCEDRWLFRAHSY